MNDWVANVPSEDLNTLHHGLRLSAKYPGMSDEEREALTRLADACWDEHCRRTAEQIEIERALVTPTDVTREELATVLWPRLLDLAPLTIEERKVLGRFVAIVAGPDDELTADFRARCLSSALGHSTKPPYPPLDPSNRGSRRKRWILGRRG